MTTASTLTDANWFEMEYHLIASVERRVPCVIYLPEGPGTGPGTRGYYRISFWTSLIKPIRKWISLISIFGIPLKSHVHDMLIQNRSTILNIWSSLPGPVPGPSIIEMFRILYRRWKIAQLLSAISRNIHKLYSTIGWSLIMGPRVSAFHMVQL